MKIGVATAFNSAHEPAAIAAIAGAIEEMGFHSLWVPEHVVFFPDYASQYPYSTDGRIPGNPDGVIDPFSALTFVAAHTSTIRLGTGICLVPQRHPIYTARQVSDIDYLSNGRFDFGVGVGWLREEFDALNIPWAKRGARTVECLDAMKALWTQEEATFKGENYAFERCQQTPKPVQTPHPPIYFGGESAPALRRVASHGQGWYGYNLTPETLPALLSDLDAALAEAGRSRTDIDVFVGAHPSAWDTDSLAAFADLGVDQVIVGAAGRTADKIRGRLERFADALQAAA